MHSAIFTATFGREDIVLSWPKLAFASGLTRESGCMSKKSAVGKAIEFEPAWARFERAVKVVAKSPPQHRMKKTKAKKRKKKPGK
jgi:hypothetical protein